MKRVGGQFARDLLSLFHFSYFTLLTSLFRVSGRAQIPLSRVTDERQQGFPPELGTLADLAHREHVRARGGAGEDAFLAGQPAGGSLRSLVAHGKHLVDDGTVQDRRDEPRADAL